MSKPKVIVTRKWPKSVEAVLADLFDAELNKADEQFSEEALKDALTRADAVLTTATDRMTAEILATETRRARVIANFGVGFDHIDTVAAEKLGVTVTNTPGVLTDCTADLALTLMLMVARRAGEGEHILRTGQWMGWGPTDLLGSKLTGKTLGIIGMGRIGKAVAKRAHYGFDMKVVFYNRSPVDHDEARALGATQLSDIDDVVARSDFLSLHCPGGKGTSHLMNEDRIGRMKPSAFLINTARGDVVDEDALATALNEGRIAGAGLDVYQGEPMINPVLLKARNTVLLPHLGSATVETRNAMGMRVVENLKAFFAGQPVPDRVV